MCKYGHFLFVEKSLKITLLEKSGDNYIRSLEKVCQYNIKYMLVTRM